MLWRQDTENNSTAPRSGILVPIAESKENTCVKSIVKKKSGDTSVHLLGFSWGGRGGGNLKILINRFNCCHDVMSLYGGGEGVLDENKPRIC